MATTLLVLGAIWLALSLVFCLALCMAAAKPLPKIEDREGLMRSEHQTMKAVGDDALCAR